MDSDGPSTVSLTVDRAAWQAVVADPEQLCRQAVLATLRRAAPWLAVAEVSVLLCDDAEIRRLNASYRGQDRATNVLSFPALELDPDQTPAAPGASPVLLGDIVLAAETVRTEALAQGKPPEDHFRHLIVHGCLHLLGHDHQDEAGASRMERLERLILAELGIPDPYAEAPSGRGDAAFAEAGA
jgi:probable rRNA maturation factor